MVCCYGLLVVKQLHQDLIRPTTGFVYDEKTSITVIMIPTVADCEKNGIRYKKIVLDDICNPCDEGSVVDFHAFFF